MIANNTLCATVTGAMHILSSCCSTALIRSCLSVVKLTALNIHFNIPRFYVWHEPHVSETWGLYYPWGKCCSVIIYIIQTCCITIQWDVETNTRHEPCHVFIMHYSIWHLLKSALFLHFKRSQYIIYDDAKMNENLKVNGYMWLYLW